MTRNDIKELFPEAGKEAIDALLNINSADIGNALNKQRASVDELTQQVKTLTEQLAAKDGDIAQRNGDLSKRDEELASLNAKLEAAIAKANDADTLRQQVEQLTKDVSDRDATIASTTRQYKIKDALRGMNVKDVDVIWPLLNLDNITEKKGELSGLTEQVDALKQSYSYLFNTNTGDVRGGFAGSQDIGGKDTNSNDIVNNAIRLASGRG